MNKLNSKANKSVDVDNRVDWSLSAIIKDIASDLGLPVQDLQLVKCDPLDVVGLPKFETVLNEVENSLKK